MPLLDHFHPPISQRRHWSELHGWWPGEMARLLLKDLPAGFEAGPRFYLGSSLEVDVSVTERAGRSELPDAGNAGGVATLPSLDEPYTVVADLLSDDLYEVRIYDTDRARTLVAAIEIVSPSNKDRPESRALFAWKCAAMLHEGVCVSIIDVVTDRHANLYVETLNQLKSTDHGLGQEPPTLYAVTMRARTISTRPQLIDSWYYPLSLGQPLPTLPLWLSPTLRIALPLEPSYAECCRLLKLS
jgi:hypothetical protein